MVELIFFFFFFFFKSFIYPEQTLAHASFLCLSSVTSRYAGNDICYILNASTNE